MSSPDSLIAPMPPSHPALTRVRDLADLRELPADELPRLAEEIREPLVSTVTRTGGHLGPNLGVVELTIALHRVFSSPDDAIVFDTGPQGYVHKILTGRWPEFELLRQAGGLSGCRCSRTSASPTSARSTGTTSTSWTGRCARRALCRPVVVHCVTTKGKGHGPAETDEADRLHAVPPASAPPPARPTWTSVFGNEIVELGHRGPDLACVTAAMLRPTGLHRFAEVFPERTHDVGIAEQHAVTCAAGLAMGGADGAAVPPRLDRPGRARAAADRRGSTCCRRATAATSCW